MYASLPYIQVFCRIAICLVFAISCLSKLRQFSDFQLTIIKFNLIPQRLTHGAAILLITGEGLVVALLASGGPLVSIGFVLALCLLVLFTGALSSVLLRHIKTACLCFGSSDKDASSIDIWRNAGLLLCTLVGYISGFLQAPGESSLTLVSYILLALMAAVLVTVWIQLNEVVELFQ